ncbi:MAG: TraM recognition domain-containing protein [Nocardioides sp.]
MSATAAGSGSSLSDEAAVGAAIGGLLVTAAATIWISLHGAAAIAGDPAPARNPAALLVDLAQGRTSWSTWASVLAVGAVAAVSAPLVLWLVSRGRRRGSVDGAARFMATGADLAGLSAKGARRKAAQLGAVVDTPGVPVGEAVRTRQRLWSSWEDMVVLIAGPRTMKTTAYAIPAALAAPGALLVTSNKRDVVDATRGPRSERGRVWIFDPEHVTGEPATWWWNPLTYIAAHDPATGLARRDPATGLAVADEARAEKLAAQFVASSIPAGARQDAYFDGEAENLIALLLLAAACGDHPITTVYRWLATPADESPIDLLGEHRFDLHESSLYALAHLPDKQREGVYGTARARMGWLRNRALSEWVTPPANPAAGEASPQLHPAELAGSADTLYALSRKDEGSAAPLVAALTLAVLDALEERATASPGGRLMVPFLAVLDEAANICRLRNLDSYYSHFGSRGIIMLTILQNWAQGEDVWGPKGMEKLWSAANVKIYGGGVDDDRFLKRISDLVGPYDRVMRSDSHSRSGRSRSRSLHERPILTVAQLRELNGRGVLFASGTRPSLIRPQPWFEDRDAARIRASIALHAPQGPR